MYIVSVVEIENGVITSYKFAKTKTIKEFLTHVPYKPTIFKVRGYKFNTVYLTQGTKENGHGYAFVKI